MLSCPHTHHEKEHAGRCKKRGPEAQQKRRQMRHGERHDPAIETQGTIETQANCDAWNGDAMPRMMMLSKEQHINL